MINTGSIALSFAKQMSGFRNSSSSKAAKGFATANKILHQFLRIALTLGLTSDPQRALVLPLPLCWVFGSFSLPDTL